MTDGLIAAIVTRYRNNCSTNENKLLPYRLVSVLTLFGHKV